MKHHLAVFLLSLSVAMAQTPANREAKEPSWDTTQTRGKTRSVNFSTQEGTWMSVDPSPDGKWIVFDLLAHIYRVPAAGGDAECLTQASGAALNFHPRYSPDGKSIAFVSDRNGQNNLWIMNADGSRPRAVFSNKDIRVFEPAWTPDGEFLNISVSAALTVGPAITSFMVLSYCDWRYSDRKVSAGFSRVIREAGIVAATSVANRMPKATAASVSGSADRIP